MNKRNKIILIITLIIFVLIVIAFACLIRYKNIEQKEETPQKQENFDVNQSLEVDICKNQENCPIAKKTVYSMIEMKTDNEQIKKVLDKINKETKKRYNQTINSSFDNEKCPNNKDIYNYSYLSTLDYSLYENNDYISINIIRYNEDLCLNTNTMEKPKSYIFSKKENKFISDNDLKKQFKIDNKQIENSIKRVIKNMNNVFKKNYKYEDTFLDGKQDLIYYFDYEGNLNVYFHINEDNSYSSCTLIEVK